MTKYSADAATRYAQRVVDGMIPTGELVKLAAQRHLDDLEHGHERGLWYDEAQAAEVVRFYGLLPHIKGEWARRNERLHIEDWQAFTVAPLFAWKHEGSNLRRFRTSYEEVARKNAKSTKTAGTGLRLAFFDGEPGAEVYSFATKMDQAKIIWNDAKAMVQKSPGLRQRITPYALSLARAAQSQVFRPLGSDKSTTDGLNGHGGLADELHAHRSRDMWDLIETSQGARMQPLMSAITTAGFDRGSICWEQRKYGVDVLTGSIVDDAFYAYIATIDEGDDPFDPAVWVKANPNLIGSPGLDMGSVYHEYIAQQARRAQEVPGRLNAFLRLHLDVWTEQAQRWIDVAAWDAGAKRDLPARLDGRQCFVGLDTSSATGIAGYSLLFPPAPGDERWYVILKCFAPASPDDPREPEDVRRFAQWVQGGHLTMTPGRVIDLPAIRASIQADALRYQVKEVAYDPWNATEIVKDLEADGATCEPVRMTYGGLTSACKEFERLILSQSISDGGNPIMRTMIGATAVVTDSESNLRPSKEKSGDNIAGVVATLNALARASIYRARIVKPPTVYVFSDTELDDFEGFE